MNQHFLEIFERDILKIKTEIEAYGQETLIWKTEKGISNSSGTLCLHVTGNLNHFIGSVLGKTGHVRQREQEFTQRNITKADLLKGLDDAWAVVHKTLLQMEKQDFEKEYPIDFQGQRMTFQVLILLLTHLNYHLGQINYHRRLVS